MSGVQIDIQRTGFPVKVGEIELWFDSSHENLVNFFNLAEKVQEESEKNIEEMKSIELPDNYLDAMNDLSGVHQKGLELLEHKKKQTAIEYDLLFGKGTFKKIYEKYPDYVALQNASKAINEAIQEKVINQEEERAKAFDNETEEMLKRKAKKKANKK